MLGCLCSDIGSTVKPGSVATGILISSCFIALKCKQDHGPVFRTTSRDRHAISRFGNWPKRCGISLWQIFRAMDLFDTPPTACSYILAFNSLCKSHQLFTSTHVATHFRNELNLVTVSQCFVFQIHLVVRLPIQPR